MTNKEIKQYVKAWMNSHQPNTFVKNENGMVMYSAGHSSINLTLFFEDLLEDFAQSSLFSKKDREIEELKKEIKEMQIVEKDICDLTWKQNKIIQSLKSQPDSKGGRDLSDEEINSLSYQYASKEYVGENNTFQMYACQDGYKKGYYDALKLSSKEGSKAGFSEEWIVECLQQMRMGLGLYGLYGADSCKEWAKKYFTPPTSKVEAKPSLQEVDEIYEKAFNIKITPSTDSKEAVEAKPMSIEECKDAVAHSRGFWAGWDDSDLTDERRLSLVDEAITLYANQYK